MLKLKSCIVLIGLCWLTDACGMRLSNKMDVAMNPNVHQIMKLKEILLKEEVGHRRGGFGVNLSKAFEEERLKKEQHQKDVACAREKGWTWYLLEKKCGHIIGYHPFYQILNYIKPELTDEDKEILASRFKLEYEEVILPETRQISSFNRLKHQISYFFNPWHRRSNEFIKVGLNRDLDIKYYEELFYFHDRLRLDPVTGFVQLVCHGCKRAEKTHIVWSENGEPQWPTEACENGLDFGFYHDVCYPLSSQEKSNGELRLCWIRSQIRSKDIFSFVDAKKGNVLAHFPHYLKHEGYNRIVWTPDKKRLVFFYCVRKREREPAYNYSSINIFNLEKLSKLGPIIDDPNYDQACLLKKFARDKDVLTEWDKNQLIAMGYEVD